MVQNEVCLEYCLYFYDFYVYHLNMNSSRLSLFVYFLGHFNGMEREGGGVQSFYGSRFLNPLGLRFTIYFIRSKATYICVYYKSF